MKIFKVFLCGINQVYTEVYYYCWEYLRYFKYDPKHKLELNFNHTFTFLKEFLALIKSTNKAR